MILTQVEESGAQPVSRATPAAWYALCVLAAVTFCALLDRQILVLLAEPIRRDLDLNDLQLGMVQGFGVSMFAALAGYPLGWAADRLDRRVVLATCIAVWSVAVVGCALSASFSSLLLSGAMVGAGEAGLAPVMYALIPLYFFGRQRQIANSIAAMASVGGGALAFTAAGAIVGAAGGWRAELLPPLGGLAEWRLSLLAAAALAPVMVLLVLSIRLPDARGAAAKSRPAITATAATRSYFWQHRSAYTRFYLGGAMGSVAFVALAVWLAVAAARNFGQTPAEIGAAFGAAQIMSAGCGFLLSIVVTQVYGQRFGGALPVRMMWSGMVLAAIVLAWLPWATSALQLYIGYGVSGIFLTFAAMAFPTALQNISPPHLRGRAAFIQFSVSMLAASGSAPLVGAISDQLGGSAGVLTALTLVAVPALVIGALLLRSCDGRALDELLADAASIPVTDVPSA